jgi:hypothetical protein
MLNAFGGDEFVGNLLHDGGLATDDKDLQAVVVVEVDVEGGNDQLVVVVLNVGERGLDVLFMMVVNEGDGAGNFLSTKVLAVFNEAGANHVGDGQGAVVVALLASHLVQLFGQVARSGDSETDNALGLVAFHAEYGSKGPGRVNCEWYPVRGS